MFKTIIHRNAEATRLPSTDIGAKTMGSVLFTSLGFCEMAEKVVAAARQ
ncbi:hypothetical protein J5Y03_00950 [Bacillus sp. RG28]|uniref:Uncharacterized protein n=1 Tax=Gottfriedia endophytica TaxID=2820819 RepID=A0A940NN42_9BACI|nr:hypothetical protein [Gottfriedia endophytica]MBP0723746.1 hypothetical protein [Gottfriedia endophytica]